MRMIFFDYRKSEEKFFEKHRFQDFNIIFYKNNLSENTALSNEDRDNTEIISIFITSQITENVLLKFKNLKIIATRSSGYNHIDIQACKKYNIAVVNVEGYGKRSVAQYTTGAILGLVRNFVPAVKDFNLDNSDFDKYTGFDLEDLTLGIIGTGSIGASVAQIMHFFGMKILAYDNKINSEIKDFVEYVPLEDLYKYSNIITLHIPYSQNLYHMISDEEFDIMINGVYIVNSSRGELIDSIALFKAIKSNKVAGAAIDVLECENLNMYPDNFVNIMQESSSICLENAIINKRLIEEPNVFITPHIAYNTYSAINTILVDTFLNIQKYFNGELQNRII